MRRRLAAVMAVGLAALAGCSAAVTPAATPTAGATAVPLMMTPVPTARQARPTQTPRVIAGDTPAVTTTDAPEGTRIVLPTATASPALDTRIVAAVGRGGIRMRAAPDANSPLLASVSQNMLLTIMARTADNEWIQVQTPDGDTGWILVYFLNAAIDLDSLDIPVVAAPPRPTANILPALPMPAPAAMRYISGITPNARAIFRQGQAMGNRANVFSKVGDSLTVGTYFLYPIGWGEYNLRDYGYLAPVVAYFSAATARDGNSFGNNSLAADNGWSTEDALNPALAHPQLCGQGETPLACEYRVVRPAVALILFGTNDVAEVPLETFRANMQRIVETTVRMGIIPVVSTIPARAGFEQAVLQYNAAIIATARAYEAPLWDYWSVMRTLPNQGLSPDGVHPSYPADYRLAADFTAENLQYGYTVRNLTALQALDAVWQGAMSNE